jgi:mono/diheme cytochrome c family protein
MPAFPTLSAEELAAVATYVRGGWENRFSAARPEEVALILERLGGTVEEISIWQEVYTEEQAKRGEKAYCGPCGFCHGRRLNRAPDDADMRPSPPLARAKFIRNWNGRSLGSLYAFTRATMPQSNPGYMPDQTYVDIIAHMLAMTGAPAGDTELTPDPAFLARIIIGPRPK